MAPSRRLGTGRRRPRRPRVSRAAVRRRLDGVDAARALALAGMASVHILPVRTAAGADTVAGAIAGGRASALFAVLAGVGIALASGGPTPVGRGRPHAAAAAGLLVRGLLVALIGLTLVALDPPVAVILAYYGLLFWLATPLLRLRAPALGALAAVWCVAGPVASHLLRAGREAGPGDQPGFAALGTPGRAAARADADRLLPGAAVADLPARRDGGGPPGPALAAGRGRAARRGRRAGRRGVGGVGAAAGPGRRCCGARPGPHPAPLRHRPHGQLVVARRRGPAHRHAVRPRAHHRHRARGAGPDAPAGPRGRRCWCGRWRRSGRCR